MLAVWTVWKCSVRYEQQSLQLVPIKLVQVCALLHSALNNSRHLETYVCRPKRATIATGVSRLHHGFSDESHKHWQACNIYIRCSDSHRSWVVFSNYSSPFVPTSSAQTSHKLESRRQCQFLFGERAHTRVSRGCGWKGMLLLVSLITSPLVLKPFAHFICIFFVATFIS